MQRKTHALDFGACTEYMYIRIRQLHTLVRLSGFLSYLQVLRTPYNTYVEKKNCPQSGLQTENQVFYDIGYDSGLPDFMSVILKAVALRPGSMVTLTYESF